MPRIAVPYVLSLDVEDGPAKLSRRVSASVVRAIAGGQLSDGDQLPSTRTLAVGLGIARSVVIEAFDELVSAGFLTSRAGSGTRVEVGAGDASRAGAFSSSVVRPQNTRSADPDQVDVEFNLMPGFPDPSLVNEKDWRRAWRRASGQSLRNIDPGYRESDSGRQHNFHRELREQLAEHLRSSRGLLTDPSQVFVFAGVNAAIRTLTQATIKPGKTLAFEDPGYATGRRAFVAAGSEVRAVPVDEQGLIVDNLGPSDWGVYVTPAHHFPLGARLSAVRRAALLEWAVEHEAVVFEDDYDGEFRYDVAPLPALRAMTAGADRVIYLGTASKVLARDLRVAWAVVPERMSAGVRNLLLDEGETVSATSALAMADFIESGALVRQISSSHRTYAARRARFAGACEDLLPTARLHGVDAGLHVVLTFDDPINDEAITDELLANGLACAPLSRYLHQTGPVGLQGLVCGYSRLPETKALAAVSRIRDVLAANRTR